MPELTEKQRERIALAAAVIEETENASADEIASLLSGACANFLGELDALSESQAAFSSGEGEWSVSEVCRHMANATRLTAGGIQMLAQGASVGDGKPAKMGVLDPDPGSFEAVRKSVEETFDAYAQAVRALEGEPSLEETLLHPLFGELNCRKLASFGILHINIHVAQLQRIKSAENFPAGA